MPINPSVVGAVGSHTFQKTNVHLVDNYIYFKAITGQPATAIPAALTDGTGYIYRSGVGSLGGITTEGLVFANIVDTKTLELTDTSNGLAIDLTSATGGAITFDTPIVYDQKLNIDASTATNQAVKYYTNSTPLTGLTSGSTYFLKNVSASSFAGAQALYSIASNTHTFTTCGLTGRVGPTQAQMRAAYSTTWDETYLSQGAFQGYQDWTVPVSGIYEFTASGASGYNGSGGGGVGRGAVVKGRVTLTKGEIITIAVGQQGAAPSASNVIGGSGGGTFIVRKSSNEPLFVAGGGSAESDSSAGRDGVLTSVGGASQTGALGGLESFGGRALGGFSGGGGGFSSRGENSVTGETGGGAFNDGLVAATSARTGGSGGFGGGGSGDQQSRNQSGGGGGYSGGAGARTNTSIRSGGGGGSFIAATATNVATSTGLYNGTSTFNGSAITNLSSYNTGEGSVVMTIVSTFTTGNEVYPTAADSEAGTNKIAIGSAGTAYHALFLLRNHEMEYIEHFVQCL